MAEALTVQAGEFLDWTADGTYSQGDVIQVPDGRAGIVRADCVSGDIIAVEVTQGLIVEVPKTASMVMLRSSKLFWDHSTNKANLLHGGDRDFYLGVCVEDATSSGTTVNVALNKQPVFAASFEHGFASVLVQTAGFPAATGAGREGVNLWFSATAEVQKADALSHRGFLAASEGIAHFLVCVNDNGDAAAVDMDWGIATATHASDVEAIAQRVVFHLDGNTLDLDLASDDNVTDTTLIDTTINVVEGTPFLCQLDLRDIAAIKAYVNGVRVLDGVTGAATTLAIATGTFKCLAHIEKSSDDTPGNLSVLYGGVATSQA